MGMSDVNGYEILSALDEPVDEFLRMFNGQKRIDKDGIAFTMNQCDGVGNPGQILLARRKSLSNAGTLLRQELQCSPRLRRRRTVIDRTGLT